MENTNMTTVAAVMVIGLLVGAGVGYYMGETHLHQRPVETETTTPATPVNPDYVTRDTFDSYTNLIWICLAISVAAFGLSVSIAYILWG